MLLLYCPLSTFLWTPLEYLIKTHTAHLKPYTIPAYHSICKSKTDRKQDLYKTLHRKLKFEQHESHKIQEANSGAPER